VGHLGPTLALLALLAAVEGVVRLTCPPISTLEAFVVAPEQQFGFTDRRHVRIFEGDPLLGWRLQPDLDHVVWDFTVVSTNPQGLRHPGRLGPKPEGGFRIVAFGDSVTFGYRVPVVYPGQDTYDPADQPFPRVLEDALRAAHPGRAVDVVALAVPGYSSHQGLAWLRRDLAALRPDVVLWCFGWNDVSLRGAPDRVTLDPSWGIVALRRLATHSQAFVRASLALRPQITGHAGEGVPRVGVEEYVGNAQAAVAAARAQGALALVIGPVYRDAETFPAEARRLASHRAALRDAMAADGTPYLEVPELTEGAWPANDGLFGETIHPNVVGHRLLAERILRALTAAGALGTLGPDQPASQSPS
jgi:lysophospholipase L1-like esterase